jgi:mRNA-degrading endonuclease YafQ of YafQ-DinJ toxin-antitoxin module
MKKIIRRTKRFEKSFLSLVPKIQKLFIKKLSLFIDNEHSPSLKTHKLKGELQNQHAFSVTDDIRAVYEKILIKDQELIIFTFIDIGGHNKVY